MPARPPSARGNWAALSVHPAFPWPEEEECILYRGHNVWLLPGVDGRFPMVAIECTEAQISSDDGFRLLRRFLSSLVWSESQSVVIESGSGGTYPFRHLMPQGLTIVKSTHPVHFDYLPEPEDPRQKLCLALYREALESSNPAYRVLGLFKVFNVVHAGGAHQKRWINGNLAKVRSNRTRLEELQIQEDVGDYLWRSGRCAVAHAFSEPLIDPDEHEDYKRLSRDAELIRELAVIFIEQEIGIKTSQTIMQEHLYELAGFKELLGTEIVQVLSAGEPLPDDIELPNLPAMSIRLRDEKQFDALENMSVRPGYVTQEGVLVLKLSKDEDAVVTYVALDISAERLHIDIESGFEIPDDGTQAAPRRAADIMRFKQQYVLNGVLEVWNVEQSTLLGRCDPFMPVNIDLVATSRNFERGAEIFDAIARERQASGRLDRDERDTGPSSAPPGNTST